MHGLARVVARTAVALLALGFSAVINSATAQTESCGFCQDMEGGGGWGHSFQSPGALFDKATEHPGWGPGLCGDWHGGCHPEEDATFSLAEAERIASGDDARAIARLIEQHPDRVQFVASRGAIQLRGCGERIVAHIALSDDLLSDLLR